jgi:hypothetical protein
LFSLLYILSIVFSVSEPTLAVEITSLKLQYAMCRMPHIQVVSSFYYLCTYGTSTNKQFVVNYCILLCSAVLLDIEDCKMLDYFVVTQEK